MANLYSAGLTLPLTQLPRGCLPGTCAPGRLPGTPFLPLALAVPFPEGLAGPKSLPPPGSQEERRPIPCPTRDYHWDPEDSYSLWTFTCQSAKWGWRSFNQKMIPRPQQLCYLGPKPATQGACRRKGGHPVSPPPLPVPHQIGHGPLFLSREAEKELTLGFSSVAQWVVGCCRMASLGEARKVRSQERAEQGVAKPGQASCVRVDACVWIL